MAKKNKEKGKKSRSTPLSRVPQGDKRSIWHRIPLFAKAAIAAAVTLFSLWGGYVEIVKPRVRIEPPPSSADPRKPYDAPFSLINDGPLSVYKVTVDCKPITIALSGTLPASPMAPWKIQGVKAARVLTLEELVADDHKPFVCDPFRQINTENMKIDGVVLRITVTVSPIPFGKLSYPKSVLFKAASDGTNKFKWHELGIGELPRFPGSPIFVRERER